jgi:hypothetical protein
MTLARPTQRAMIKATWKISKNRELMMTKVNKTKPVLSFGHPECYAKKLKGCCIQMSGEHPLSKAILERIDKELGEKSVAVDVRNMAFQPPATVESLGIRGMESKILCQQHNCRLGDYDSEGLKAFEAFERLHYAAAGRQVQVEPVYTLDGDRLERFFLKALCGGLYAGLFPVEETARMKGIEPPLGWLETIYGDEAFPEGYGLYMVPCAFHTDRVIVKWAPLLLATEGYVSIHGMRFWLFGFEFTLLAPGPEPRAVESLTDQSYRPNGVTIDGSGTRIAFAWDDGPGSREIGLQLA